MKNLMDEIQKCEIVDDGEVTLAGHFIRIMQQAYEDVCSSQGVIWTYERGCWTRQDAEDVMALIQGFDGLAFFRMSGAPGRVKLSNSKVNGVYQSLLIHRQLLRSGYFDEVAAGVCFADGFVSIKDDRIVMEEHSPQHKATMRIEQDAPTNVVVPRSFIAFLQDLFRDDEDQGVKIELIREFCGAALSNIAVRFSRVLLLTGGGANGKSTLARIIEGLFPPEHVAATSPARWNSEYQLALLAGCRINICTELPTADNDVSDLFKAVVAGDQIICRMPYQAPQKLRPKAAHIFSSNYLPNSKDFSEGYFRRFLIVPLNRNFQKEGVVRTMDSIIADMDKEQAAIIMWALQGAVNLIQRGHYVMPSSGIEAEQEWRVEADAVLDFVMSCCTRRDDRKDFEYLSTIYDDFKDWCMRMSRKPMGPRKFASRLVSLDVPKEKIGGQSKVGLSSKPRINWSDWGLN